MNERPILTTDKIFTAFLMNTTLKARAILADTFSKTAEVAGAVEDVANGVRTMPGIISVHLKDGAMPDFRITANFRAESDKQLTEQLLALKKNEKVSITGELGFFAQGVLNLENCRFNYE